MPYFSCSSEYVSEGYIVCAKPVAYNIVFPLNGKFNYLPLL